MLDSNWEGIAAKTMEELQQVKSYVKNQFSGLAVPYVKDGIDKNCFSDFVAQCKSNDGIIINLMIEITGMSKEKARKKWFVEN